MTSPTRIPPIFGLSWQPHVHPFAPDLEFWSARRTPEFDDASFVSKLRQPKCLAESHGDLLILNPAFYSAEEFQTWSVALQAGVDAHAVAQAAEAEADAIEAAAKRKRQHDYSGSVHAAAVRNAIAEAQALYDGYGAACRPLKPMLDLIHLVYLDPIELRRLRKTIAAVRAGLTCMDIVARGVEPKPTDVYLDDEFVERAIRVLTAHDADRRTLPNRIGWGGKTSAPGHWVCAMLKTDRDIAIEIRRPLVSHHLRQLAKLGVVPAAGTTAA